MDFADFLVRAIGETLFTTPATHSTKDIYDRVEKCDNLTVEKITQAVLKAMYCENTGTHFLDSGGAYGRGWQRCQAIKDQDWMDQPWTVVDVTLRASGDFDFYVLKNAYQFLCQYLEYDVKMDKWFHSFCNQDKTFKFKHWHRAWGDKPGYWEEEKFNPKKESYYACMRAWKQLILNGFDAESHGGYNTYNGDSCLDKTLQWEHISIANGDYEGEYLILQVHNGCDVRGGYSTPHIFRVEMDEFWSMVDDLTCRCPNHGIPDNRLNGTKQRTLDGKIIDDKYDHVDCYSDDCGYHWYGNCGSALEGMKCIEEDEPKLVCKKCGAELEFF